jgi:hypothetical protein
VGDGEDFSRARAERVQVVVGVGPSNPYLYRSEHGLGPRPLNFFTDLGV